MTWDFRTGSAIAARLVPVLFSLAVVALVSICSVRSAAAASPEFTPQELAAARLNIIDILGRDPNLPLPVRQRRDELLGYYGDEAGSLLWLGATRSNDFLNRLRAADEDGLDPAAYPVDRLAHVMESAANADIRAKSIVELYFSASFLEYASDLRVGRFLPHKVDPNFFIEQRAIDQRAALRALSSAPSVDAFFTGWQPQSSGYAGLRQLLTDYRALASIGGWPTNVPLGEPIRPGMSDDRIPLLRERLVVTDGGSGVEDASLEYDAALVEAVKRFQTRHGLDADGTVGPATIAALNIPVEDRMQEIAAAMERWRWLPEDLGGDFVMVNIAGFDLKLVRDGKIVDDMVVVVGKPYSRTPAFSDAIRYVELNPYWNVPSGIALKEELPKLRRNPAARASDGFEAIRGGTVYPLTSINWSQYGPGNFPFQLRQRPGKDNALGRAKFVFPNRFDVYLHDTPAKSLFARSERAFSHGCIRLSRPIDLAAEVLGPQGWTRDRIDQAVGSGKRTVVNLTEPLPIHITYFTAWVDNNGTANFRNDIYEQDAKLLAALQGQSLSW
jgi:murein L,D-transpeptidase YcbB/YkuD